MFLVPLKVFPSVSVEFVKAADVKVIAALGDSLTVSDQTNLYDVQSFEWEIYHSNLCLHYNISPSCCRQLLELMAPQFSRYLLNFVKFPGGKSEISVFVYL